VVLSVSEYPVKPVSVKGRYYKRTGNSNHLMSVAEVANMHLQTVNSSWDYYPRPEKTTADLSFEKVQRAIDIITRRSPNNRIASVEEFLQKHELVKGVAITNACYLMFCKDENLYTTIQMGHFASETVIKDDVTTSKDILSQVDEVMSFVMKHINKEIIISGQPENTEHWQYPLEGIREIVLNMIIHRDYISPADSIVKVFSDHILFYNPGNLPNNITIEQLLSNTYVSTPRNRQIAKITKEMGWIEKYGTGIKRVLDIFRDYGLPQPRFELIPGGFAVTVFSEMGQNGKQKTDLKTNLKTDLKTDNVDEKIKSLITDNKHITIHKIANSINLSVSGTKLRINRLRNNGSIARVGSAKGGHWEIPAI
jgi:ATP-dependent DNA helicase RecG